MDSLEQLTEDWLVKRVSKDTVATVVALAYRPGSEALLKTCVNCLRDCLDEVKVTQEWKDIFGNAGDFAAKMFEEVKGNCARPD